MAMKISVELSHVCPLEDIPGHGAAIEFMGFYRAWIPDTLVSPWEAWLAADIMVHHTKHLKIGLGVTNPYTRHPVVVAQMAATLQAYSGGRLSLSVGRGISRFLEKAGIKQHPAAVEECIAIVRALMTGERLTFNGNAYQIDALRLRTLPVQNPVPIYLAAMGPESWEAAFRTADGVATIWSDEAAKMRSRAMAGRRLPTAALIPFSVSQDPFFQNKADSIEALEERVNAAKTADFDEVIIAYRDMSDLEIAAKIVRDNALRQ
jgi:alkanesulfonate monooxygenase SsuD/methylene tetrahydromethanopterin reductase-like flavin-dependent oxidoreductase (luciferase family)